MKPIRGTVLLDDTTRVISTGMWVEITQFDEYRGYSENIVLTKEAALNLRQLLNKLFEPKRKGQLWKSWVSPSDIT